MKLTKPSPTASRNCVLSTGITSSTTINLMYTLEELLCGLGTKIIE